VDQATWEKLYPELVYPGEGVILYPWDAQLTPEGQQYVDQGGTIGGISPGDLAALQAEYEVNIKSDPLPPSTPMLPSMTYEPPADIDTTILDFDGGNGAQLSDPTVSDFITDVAPPIVGAAAPDLALDFNGGDALSGDLPWLGHHYI
tara:strand:+ start:2280 stop:2720 length:441 start_codon:yes stop_codon:yes gene_type:complete